MPWDVGTSSPTTRGSSPGEPWPTSCTCCCRCVAEADFLSYPPSLPGSFSHLRLLWPWSQEQTMWEETEKLKRHISLLDYLRQHNCSLHPVGAQQEFVGLCPLHAETRPSLYVNAAKNLFFCHGCGRGGDLIRFAQLYFDLSFPQAVARLREELAPLLASETELLQQAVAFYQTQLPRHGEALQYLHQRGLHDSNLIDRQGRDTLYRRVVFPCRERGRLSNLYGRSLDTGPAHRFLARPKGDLYAWETVSAFPWVILVEGLFDLAVLWQA